MCSQIRFWQITLQRVCGDLCECFKRVVCGFAAGFKSVVCVLVLLLSRFAELVCASVFCLGLRFAKKSDEKK